MEKTTKKAKKLTQKQIERGEIKAAEATNKAIERGEINYPAPAIWTPGESFGF